MRGIGEVARESGLNVSTLRFYDGAGVLTPAWVDPVSGYRWYRPEQLGEARLLVRLRRVGMPLADIRLVLAGWSNADTDLVRKLLEAHLHRLEAGLSDARRELSAVRALLDHREHPMTRTRTTVPSLTLSAPGLAGALDAVRFAVSTDPELPMLGGVLFDFEDDVLRVVATDRYRMAVSRTPVSGYDGARTQTIVPVPLVDAMRALLNGEGPARLAVDGGRVTMETEGREVAGRCLGHEFPDYRRLVDVPAGRRVTVDVPALREAVAAGPVDREREGTSAAVTVLTVTDGTVTVSADDDDAERVAVNREFLMDALTAGARDELEMEFGGPMAPLTVRRPDAGDTFSMLMPFRLER